MSAVISAFPSQSTGGGGALVLNCIYKATVSTYIALSYDLPYGGLVCLGRYGHTFSINCGSVNTNESSSTLFMTYGTSGTQAYRIPLPPGTLSVTMNGSGTGSLGIFRYELMQA